MPEIEDGESVEIKGSGRDPYILKNVGGVYSCTCPAWRNQSMGIERRTCKHLRQYRGDEAETERLGGELPARAVKTKATKTSTDSGESATEPAILLAHPWKNDVDLTGWWMSEKLDGVRAYWDGKQFVSRQGNVFLAPDWFIEDLPSDITLDGELWLARKQFQRTVSIVRRQDKNDLWKEIKYVVFDAPDVEDVFEARISYIQEYLDERQPKYAQPHVHVRCRGLDHLRDELARVESLGGEGLMMRKPGSKYERCRSFTLLKVKTFHDAEARVIEHLPGTGKHTGRMGALVVELANGTRFSVGTGFSDAERENPPKPGSIITFSYQELSDRGVPRFPSYVRLRTDIDSLTDAASISPVELAQAGTAPRSKSTTERVSEKRANSSSTAVATKAVQTMKKASTEQNEGTISGSSSARYFEFVDGTSSKFWEIKVAGTQVIVRFGRIGTEGMVKPKQFASADAASKYAQEIIAEKIEKGYKEKAQENSSALTAEGQDDEENDSDTDRGVAPVSVQTQTSGSSNSITSSKALTSDMPTARKGATTDNALVSPVSTTSGGVSSDWPRYYELIDGTSSKFWEIRVEGREVIVRFGRIGTDGQTKPKVFPGEELAASYAAEIISEKEAKGYKQVSSAKFNAAPLPQQASTGAVPKQTDEEICQFGPKYFEFAEGESNKFWEIKVVDNTVTVRFGRLGTEGQVKPKTFSSAEVALEYAIEITDEKIENGYVEKSARKAPVATAVTGAPEARAASVSDADKKPPVISRSPISPTSDNHQKEKDVSSGSVKQPSALRNEPSNATPAGDKCLLGPRYFEFEEGSSSKFWEIKVVGNQVIVRFGKISTAGQVKPKPFPGEAAALAYAQRLIEEKLEKGYEEIEQEEDEEEETAEDDADVEEEQEEEQKPDDGGQGRKATPIAVAPSKSTVAAPLSRTNTAQPAQAAPITARSAANVVNLVPSRTAQVQVEEEEEEEEQDQEEDSGEGAPLTDPNAVTFGPIYMELKDSEQGKYWEIKVTTKVVYVRSGLIGVNSLWQRKPFPSEKAALQYLNAMIAVKSRQGYEQVEQ